MILVKSGREIESMRKAGRIAALALIEGGKLARPGVTTKQIDDAIRRLIQRHGASPSFLGYRGYPASCNTSVNEEVIHGIPSRRRVLQEGDIVSIDVGACFEGFHGDTAATFAVGTVSEKARRLIGVARECFFRGAARAVSGARVSEISAAIQDYAQSNGCDVVRDWTGHGVGRSLHEDPEVPNFSDGKRGSRLLPGMTLAIEPMIAAGRGKTEVLRDNWTVVTADGSLAAHYEHTVLVMAGEPELLTLTEGSV
ncbi:MAG: type I methionyl aminopeptidase [Oscillospiraceae bacterium]|jgi:methionyl aminopeptidase|nr:type I methionyl aminopeptidase [Oscillospiraceae bacterium]